MYQETRKYCSQGGVVASEEGFMAEQVARQIQRLGTVGPGDSIAPGRVARLAANLWPMYVLDRMQQSTRQPEPHESRPSTCRLVGSSPDR